MIEVKVRDDGTVDIHCDAKTAGILAGRGRKWWRHDLKLERVQDALAGLIARADVARFGERLDAHERTAAELSDRVTAALTPAFSVPPSGSPICRPAEGSNS